MTSKKYDTPYFMLFKLSDIYNLLCVVKSTAINLDEHFCCLQYCIKTKLMM
jgi:hypothetical protein